MPRSQKLENAKANNAWFPRFLTVAPPLSTTTTTTHTHANTRAPNGKTRDHLQVQWRVKLSLQRLLARRSADQQPA